jgi:hypothetical protein
VWTHIHCKKVQKVTVILVQPGPKCYVFIMAQLLVHILKKFGSGTKNSDFAVEVESVEPEKNPKYIKPSAFPRSVGISKKCLNAFCELNVQ